MTAVEVAHVSKSFVQNKRMIHALRDVSFEIRKGEIFGLLGPNGAGKTTLISAMCGLLEVDAGHIRAFGFDLQTRRDDVISKINLVTGFAGLLHGLSVEELLYYYAYLYAVPDKAAAIERVLSQTSLTEKRHQGAFTLSSGYRQRFYIAKALLSNPALLLMDEPTVGLDVDTAIRIRELVSNLRKSGMTILLTTHYMAEAAYLCDRIALISDGQIVALGTVSELKQLAGKPDATLEDVFLALTKKRLEEDDE